MKNYNLTYEKMFAISILLIILIFLMAVCFSIAHNIVHINDNNNTNTNTIDSIIKVNDSIKIKIEHIDSIKNAKVIEVQTLDNDSTLKLFYQLVQSK